MFGIQKEKEFEHTLRNGEIAKILLIRNGLLGDVVFITPVIERLHLTFPHAHIDIVVSNGAKELFKHSCVRKIIGLASKFLLSQHISLFWSLRSEHYDIVINQELNTHYTIMAALVNARFHVGFKNSLSFLSDITYTRNEHTHAVLAELDSVKLWTLTPSDGDHTKLIISDSEQENIKVLLLQHNISAADTIVCFHIGTSAQNSERFWVSDRYAEVANLLIQRNKIKIIFTGVANDKKQVDEVCSNIRYPITNLVNQTSLREMMALLYRSSVVVGPDTGTLHIACALGTPVVMLMGYADKNHTGAFNSHSTVISKNLACIGCSRRNPKPAQWEICKSLRPVYCMNEINSEEVYHAVAEKLIESDNSKSRLG